MLVMMWSASLPIQSNPFVDDHVIYALVVIGLWLIAADRTWGLGTWWQKAVGDRVGFLR
jgi:thiosulfate dehydrogenase (quinone) large subunit